MTEKACANLVRLRKKALEQGDKGDPGIRDDMNRMFLYELEQVICKKLIDKVEDTMLRSMYRKWSKAILDGVVEEEDRNDWMCGWVLLVPILAPVATATEMPLATNVVNIR
jgi:hypothetical protein